MDPGLIKAVVWRVVPWSRLVAIAVLGLLGIVATHLSALALGLLTAGVVLAVILVDAFTSVADDEP